MHHAVRKFPFNTNRRKRSLQRNRNQLCYLNNCIYSLFHNKQPYPIPIYLIYMNSNITKLSLQATINNSTKLSQFLITVFSLDILLRHSGLRRTGEHGFSRIIRPYPKRYLRSRRVQYPIANTQPTNGRQAVCIQTATKWQIQLPRRDSLPYFTQPSAIPVCIARILTLDIGYSLLDIGCSLHFCTLTPFRTTSSLNKKMCRTTR